MKISPLIKKALIWVILIGATYGGYVYFFKKSSTSTGFTTITSTVKRGDIENAVQVIGVSALVFEQKMQFSQPGKVAKILFKEWDKVKKWQIIAELDTTDVLNDIRQSEVSLNNSQLKLAQILKGATEKDLLNAKNSITSAESRITTLVNDRVNIAQEAINKQLDFENQILAKQTEIKNNTNEIDSKKAQLENAKNELAILEKTEDKGLSDDQVNIKKTLESAIINARKQIIDAESNLYKADEILGISDLNRTKNDAYEGYLSYSLKSKASEDWAMANVLMADSKSTLESLPQNGYDTESATKLLETLAKMQSRIVSLGKSGTDMMNDSMVSTVLPQSTITGYASIFSSITATAQTSLGSVRETIAGIETLADPSLQKAGSENILRSKQQSVRDLETAYTKLSVDTPEQLKRDLTKLQNDKAYSQSAYDAKLVSQDISIQEAKNLLNFYKASLQLLTSGATKEEIALAKNAIASQQISLQKVREGIKKYRLEAPFDGVLRKVDFKLWDNILTSSSSTPMYLYMENPNLVEISASVDQLDVVKLKVWQASKIVFDSFPKITFTGAVSDINSTPLVTSGVTNYSIKITMDKGEYPIFSGMSAKVNIINDSRKNTLIINTSFLQKWNNSESDSVIKQVGSAELKTLVETGISTPSKTEILSGVSEWDTLIRKISTSTGTTSIVSGLRMSGGSTNGSRSGQ